MFTFHLIYNRVSFFFCTFAPELWGVLKAESLPSAKVASI